MTFTPAAAAARMTCHWATMLIDRNGSSCAWMTRGSTSTSRRSSKEIHCAAAPMRSATARAYGRSSSPGSSK
jgi:hypothetical protein